jgi:hypothetical protein
MTTGGNGIAPSAGGFIQRIALWLFESANNQQKSWAKPTQRPTLSQTKACRRIACFSMFRRPTDEHTDV